MTEATLRVVVEESLANSAMLSNDLLDTILHATQAVIDCQGYAHLPDGRIVYYDGRIT